MNERVKKLWLEALRGDEYKQGKGYLKTVRTTVHNDQAEVIEFCCLGVLCDLHAEETSGQWVEGGRWVEGVGRGVPKYLGECALLPEEVMQWAGLREHPRVKVSTIERGLASLNDEGRSFMEIANYIEESL